MGAVEAAVKRRAVVAGILGGGILVLGLLGISRSQSGRTFQVLEGKTLVQDETREYGWMTKTTPPFNAVFPLKKGDFDQRGRVYSFAGEKDSIRKQILDELRQRGEPEPARDGQDSYFADDWYLSIVDGEFDPSTRQFRHRKAYVTVILMTAQDVDGLGKAWRWVRSNLP